MQGPPVDAFQTAIEGGRFFEAHEIMEAFWVSYAGSDRDFYKGLIQAAAALHHAARGNPAGAARVGRRARAYLAPFAPSHGGVDVTAMLDRLARSAA
jgi:predicted metal-dependent hydrolase